MSNYTELYWLTRLDYLNGLLVFLACLGFLYTLGTLLGCAMSRDFDNWKSEEEVSIREKSRQYYKSKIKFILPLAFALTILRVLTPSKSEVVFIVAGGKTIDFIQKDTSINKIPAQTTAILSKYLDEKLKELKDK